MAQIKVTDLTFAYDGSFGNVFEQVSFQLDTRWRLGLIGRNGTGKTTLLNLLRGKLDSGGAISGGTRFVYFPFDIPIRGIKTRNVVKAISTDFEPWQLARELTLLGLSEDVLLRPFDTLSGGEQTKVQLAAMFLKLDSFLLIDEPTNHLDAAGRDLVSRYLQSKQGFILVSHDRMFLDACVDHIVVINKADIQIQQGNFSSWWVNKQQSKNIERRQTRAIDEKSNLLQNIERVDSLKITPLDHHARELLQLDDLSIYYGDKTVCQHISLTIGRGEQIALCGRNGSGKSSLLKLICGEDIPHTGRIQLASGLVISAVSQDTAFLMGDLSDFAFDNGLDESLFKAILNKLDFTRQQFDKDIADFSEGQKKKVLIAKSLCEKAHLYVWDEPLNFVDIFSRMQIEDLLIAERPSLIFVEHDRSFVDKIATRTFDL